MYLMKTLAFRLHLFLLVAAIGLTAPDIAPAQNNSWALQQQRMMQSQRATQQAQQAQRAAQEAARLRQQQMIEQQRRQQALAAQQKAMREQQRIQREQQQALRAQREQQKQLRDQQQAQRTQQQAVRTQRQQQEAARQSREQQERQRLETAQRQATQTAQRQSTLTAAQQLTIRNRLQQTEQTKRLEEARRRAQQALERRKADEARTRAETNAVVAARSSGGAITAGGSNGAGQPPKPPVAAAAGGGGAGKTPPGQLPAANDNRRGAAKPQVISRTSAEYSQYKAMSEQISIRSKVSSDGFGGYRLTVQGAPKALLHATISGTTLKINNVQRGELSSGAGSAMIAEMIRRKNLKPQSIVLSNVVNKRTLSDLSKGVRPQDTTLGRMISQSVASTGRKVYNFEVIRKDGKVDIIAYVR